MIVSGQVVKSRIQGATRVPGVVPKYNWTYPASVLCYLSYLHIDSYGLPRLLTVMREEGPAALYKGFLPKVLRLAPGGGVLLLVVEVTLNLFRQSKHYLPVYSSGRRKRYLCSARAAVPMSVLR